MYWLVCLSFHWLIRCLPVALVTKLLGVLVVFLVANVCLVVGEYFYVGWFARHLVVSLTASLMGAVLFC